MSEYIGLALVCIVAFVLSFTATIHTLSLLSTQPMKVPAQCTPMGSAGQR